MPPSSSGYGDMSSTSSLSLARAGSDDSAASADSRRGELAGTSGSLPGGASAPPLHAFPTTTTTTTTSSASTTSTTTTAAATAAPASFYRSASDEEAALRDLIREASGSGDFADIEETGTVAEILAEAEADVDNDHLDGGSSGGSSSSRSGIGGAGSLGLGGVKLSAIGSTAGGEERGRCSN